MWPVRLCVTTVLQQTKNTQSLYIYIHIYLYIYMKLDNRIYSYTIIYSYIANVNLMLIWIELAEVWSFIVNMSKTLVIWSNILYLSVIYFFANKFFLNIYNKAYEGYTKPENLGFCYQPISMPNNITRKYQRHIKNPVELLWWISLTKIVND